MIRAIVLVGLMGSGKTGVGTALAQALKWEFVDTDALVEEGAGMTLEEMFSREGEEGFRKREEAAIAGIGASDPVVVACGGGAVLSDANIVALRSLGRVVYLRVSPSVAAGRVGAGAGRPLLTGPVEEQLEAMLKRRAVRYRAAAHHEVDADGSLDEVVDRVRSEVGL